MTELSQAWTPERVLALAPDPSAARAGQGLVAPAQWVSAGTDGRTLWGECRGSGSHPYQVRVDMLEPAWRCSCPSRKLPCKHALGLFLRFAAAPQSIPAAEPPAWVAEWIAQRDARAEKRETKAAEAAAQPVDAAAQAKRAARREDRVSAGMDELALWSEDLVRQGLASAPTRPPAFWEGMAARLVDAQAPGAARLVRILGAAAGSGEGWEDRVLEALGRIRLLVAAWRRIDVLPEPVREDVRAALGWTLRHEEVLAAGTVRDRWLVLGRRVDEEERLRVGRTWLRGAETGRDALVLAFAAGREPLDLSLVPGTAVDAEVAFYPGALPLRAAVGTRHGAAPLAEMPGHGTVAGAVAAYASAAAAHPWMESFPISLAAAVPLHDGGRWSVRDTEGGALPLAPSFARGWELLAASGGHPIPMFGEWDGSEFLPLGAFSAGRFVSLAPPAA
ncbi:MAG: SWIM zinc finger family protein [Gemmatimonadetes bacterium]|nr:SWIM zinc finger family protein [Gemmatimonadota bacterium]